MSDKEKLDLLVKQFKQKQEELKTENVMKKKWAAASLCSTQNKNPLFKSRLSF